MAKASFLLYNVRAKRLFFDRALVIGAIESKVHKVLFWFGGKTRESTRSYIGKPNVEGSLRTVKHGPPVEVKRRRPRPAGKPPIARVPDQALTLRNIQYKADLSRMANGFGSAQIFGINFPGAKTASKYAPVLQEFGGTVKLRAEERVLKTPKGRPRKRNGQVQKRLMFGREFPERTFRVPARPYLGPTFKKTLKMLKDRIRKEKLKGRGKR